MSSALSKRQLNVEGSSSAATTKKFKGQLNVEGSSSVATTKKFKVFMNHRGPDTKDTIAHHVYDMLADRGVEVFLDIEEMSPGEDVSEQILQAIATSQVQIAIISPNYGESKWCLIELVKMMEKHNSKTSLLIPVFYDVEPVHLKFLDNSEFGNKLNQKHIDREIPERIEQWKKALEEVAEISGFTRKQYKGQLAKRIVDEVREYMLKIGRLQVPKNVMGIENLLIEKKEEIMRQREKVTCVEIYGIGGIGKTTFAKALFNDIRQSFERGCFIEDVKGILEKDGIMRLQKILLRELLYHRDIHLASSGQGKALLVEGLEKEEILVVFDNVDRDCSLSEIFIEECGVLRPTSRIIATSRESGVIKTDSTISRSSEVIEIAMPKLDFTTSKELFLRVVFGADGTYTDEFDGTGADSEMLDSFVDKIVQKCDGIPLGLKLFGKHVSGQKISVWISFWERFKDSMPSDLAKSLHITYDGLEDLEKEIFLDVAIFFIGDEEKLVKYTWANDEGCYQVDFALHELKRKLLIEITEDGYFKMHDIIRDLGRAIVDKESPGRRSRLWRKSDIKSVLSREDKLSEKDGTEKVEGLSLVSGGMGVLKDDKDECPWEIDAIVGMSSLRVLILKDRCLEGDLSQLPKRITFLRWDDYPYDSLPILPWSSQVVQFHHGKQTNFWDPQAKVAATKLKVLNIHGSRELQSLPENLGHLLSLEHLDLSFCKILKKLPESLCDMKQLKCLLLRDCESLEFLPEDMGLLKNLCKVVLTDCIDLKKLPDSLCELKQLKELYLNGCESLEQLPEGLGQLSSIESLDLSFCRSLRKLPESLGDMKQINHLILGNCESLEFLPENIGQLENLCAVNLTDCTNLKKLPDSFWELKQLKKLCLSGCRSLEQLQEGLGQLSNIESLNLSRCRSLRNLPKSLGDMKQINHLLLRNCGSLEFLPENICQLQNLCKLDLINCTNLKKLPDSFGELKHLKELLLYGCYSLEQLPESLGQLSSIEYVDLSFCRSLRKLPESLGDMKQINHLLLRNCESLEFLRENIDQLEKLYELVLARCTNLKKLPDSIGQLENLCNLDLSFTNLKKLPDSFGELKQLKKLLLFRCHSLEQLPESLGQLCSMEFLELSFCNTLRNLPESLGDMKQMKHLLLRNCESLEFLPENIGQLENLCKLVLTDCTNLKRLPDSFGGLKQLKKLELPGCHSLEQLPEGLGQPSSIESLYLSSCTSLRIYLNY